MASGKPIIVNCPACSARTEYSAKNTWRPFCSERCKRIDLGAWASEQYRIAGAALDPTDPGQGEPPGSPSSDRH